jgi:hypothetical protein
MLGFEFLFLPDLVHVLNRLPVPFLLVLVLASATLLVAPSIQSMILLQV